MANDYYTRVKSFSQGTTAKGEDVRAELDALVTGLDKMPDEDQMASGNLNFVVAAGTGNALVVTSPTKVLTSYTGADGYKLSVKITAANTGAVTLDLDSLGAKSVVGVDGSAMITGSLVLSGIYDLFYSETLDKWLASGTTSTLRVIQMACSDETSDLTVGEGKVTFRMPHAMTLITARCSVTTAPTGSTIEVDVNESGVSVFSTVMSIDATEKTSTTATTPAVFSDLALADDAEMRVDIDQVGSTVAGAGLKVSLLGYIA